MTDLSPVSGESEMKVTESAPVSDTPETTAPVTAESSSESSEPTTEKEGGEETKTKPKVDFKGRISQIHAEKKQAEVHAKAAWTEVARLQDEIKKLQTADMSNQPFEVQDANRVREAVKTERYEEAIASAKRAQETAEQARASAFQTKVEAARERMPDFETVFTPNVPVSKVAAEFITESDKAAELAYYLGQNRQVAVDISRMPDWKQAAELARIEAKLSAAPAVRKISQAPEPVATLGGKSSPVGKDPANMSESEYIAWRKSQWAKGQK